MLKIYHIRPTDGHPGSQNGVKARMLMNEPNADYQVIAWLKRLAERPAWQEDVFQIDVAAARGRGYDI